MVARANTETADRFLYIRRTVGTMRVDRHIFCFSTNIRNSTSIAVSLRRWLLKAGSELQKRGRVAHELQWLR